MPYRTPMTELTRAELRDLREKTIETLTENFAQDLVDIDEFEERIDKAHQASDGKQLRKLLEDLERPEKALVKSESSELTSQTDTGHSLAIAKATSSETRTLVAVMGGVERKGAWRVPTKLRAFAVMGGAEIDLREAIFSPGVHEISVYTLMGGVEIIVPPNVAIECDGAGIMGGFESVNRAPVEPDPERPLVRIRGIALMGGVEISTRLPGESKRDAKKRRKRQLKAAKKRRRLRGATD